MPLRMGKKKYKSFGRAAAAISRKKGISKKRASAYVAFVQRKMGIDPRTHKKIRGSRRKR